MRIAISFCEGGREVENAGSISPAIAIAIATIRKARRGGGLARGHGFCLNSSARLPARASRRIPIAVVAGSVLNAWAVSARIAPAIASCRALGSRAEAIATAAC